ncbi:MAG TPA: hypothetical protein VJ224_00145 [Thermoplasmata archaeon]|nr:hypothetical protein [Thermoplasmata archaeon]
MMGMGPRPRLGWLLLAVAGASGLLIVVALATGASAFMTSLVGPGWWLMPILMIVVMSLVMVLAMRAMMPHDGMGMHRQDMPEDPIAIAARRYAAGEISRDEYLRVRTDLEDHGR